MINIYKPRKDNGGHYFQISMGKNNNAKGSPYAFYVKAIKQYSWNNGKGGFKENADVDGKNLVVKFNEFEVGSIMLGLETLFADFPLNDKKQHHLSLFHSMGDDKTSINFISAQSGDRKGVFFNIMRNGVTFSMPLTLGECKLIAEFCRFFLNEVWKKTNDYALNGPPSRPQKEVEQKTKKVPNIMDEKTNDPIDDVFAEGSQAEDGFDESPF